MSRSRTPVLSAGSASATTRRATATRFPAAPPTHQPTSSGGASVNAAAARPSQQPQLAQSLTCSICYEPYDTSEHQPQLLQPCGHSLCAACWLEVQKVIARATRGGPIRCVRCNAAVNGSTINYQLQKPVSSAPLKVVNATTVTPVMQLPSYTDEFAAVSSTDSDGFSQSDVQQYQQQAIVYATRYNLTERKFEAAQATHVDTQLQLYDAETNAKALSARDLQLKQTLEQVQRELQQVTQQSQQYTQSVTELRARQAKEVEALGQMQGVLRSLATQRDKADIMFRGLSGIR